MINRPLLVLASSLAVAGCSTAPYGTPGFVANYTSSAPQGRPLAMLPAAAGPVLAVNETRRSNAIVQEIVLGGNQVNGGANMISVKALTPADPTFRASTENDLKLEKPTETTIADEMGPLFPNVPMHLSAVFERNMQGPFGYAIGHGPADSTCIYAWQWIAPEQPISLLEGATGQHQFPVSVRVRLCKPRSSETALVNLVRQLMVYAPGGGGYAAPAPMMMSSAMPGDALSAAGGGGAYPAPVSPMMSPMMSPAPMMSGGFAAPMVGQADPASATVTYTYPAQASTYPSGMAMATPAYAAPSPQMSMAEASSDDDARPTRRSHRVLRHMARRSAPMRHTVARREQPTPVIGAAIPLPSDLAIPAAVARPSPTVSSKPAPVAAQDGIPLPH